MFADRIEFHINHLEGVINRFRGEPILIAADANARSVLWYNDTTDEKDEELETFILLYDLEIFNCPGEASTFENTRGHRSNIDVTLGSGSLAQRIRLLKLCESFLIFFGLYPVSYTHLDVYKRQILLCVLSCCALGSDQGQSNPVCFLLQQYGSLFK